MSTDTHAWLQTLTPADLDRDAEAIFTRLRREQPVAWTPALGAWIATTWRHCMQIAEDAANFHGGTSPAHDRLFGCPNVLGAEGHTHQRLRSVIDPPLRPRAFRAILDSAVRAAARTELSTLAGRDHAELMADYFEPVSVRCVADRFGFADVPTARLRDWFHDLSYSAAHGVADPDAFAPGDAAKTEISAVVAAMVDRLSAAPDDSAISHWLHDGMPAGHTRDIDSLFPSLLIILLGGLQEPGHACGSTFLGLTTRPDQLHRVATQPSLLPKAIAEGLRWMSPLFTGAARVAVTDIEIAGARIRRGDTVWLSYGSANRDESEFDQPDRYDLDRATHPHLAFGTGHHACAGSAFAPQIARIALEELFMAYPGLTVDPEQTVEVRGWMFRGAQQLPVRLPRET
ncbi:cytochrome P450 [Nocardia arthritidis]|uniref:cytochrome P450 n=1 Tax=Nocardia arthritidis TaxID=228602 RepID=UPI0007A3D06A|nr:cytochrome P450 [Nocardia arthritidis]